MDDTLGYFDYFNKDGRRYAIVNRPTLIPLPPKTTRVSMGNLNMKTFVAEDNWFKCVVTGARCMSVDSKYSIENIKRYVAGNPYLDIEVLDNVYPYMPQLVVLCGKTYDNLSEFAMKRGFDFVPYFYAQAILDKLPTIEDMFNYIVSTEPNDEYTADGYYKNFQCYDYNLLAKMIGQGKKFITKESIKKKNFDPELDFVIYNGYPQKPILWYKGQAYSVGSHWGHLLVLWKKGIQGIIKYDEESKSIQMPSMINIPNVYSRALTMMAGYLPIKDQGYLHYPLVDSLFSQETLKANNILKKIGQK